MAMIYAPRVRILSNFKLHKSRAPVGEGRTYGAASVGVVRDVDKLVDGRGVDVLELGGNEQRGNAEELELAPLELLLGQHAVDDDAREEEAFDGERILRNHLDEPVHEDRAHGVGDVGLHVAHVVPCDLLLQHLRQFSVNNTHKARAGQSN